MEAGKQNVEADNIMGPTGRSYFDGGFRFTMDVYSHIIEDMQEEAMALLDGVLPAGKNGVSEQNNGNSTAIQRQL
ncbi:MAG: hypothetical protein ACOC6S_02470 [Chloroflexota bacterium]